MVNSAKPLTIRFDRHRKLSALRRLTFGSDKKLAFRASIVLGADEGISKSQLAEKLGTTRPTVNYWLRRFEDAGVKGISQHVRPGRKKKITDAQIKAIRDATVLSKPTRGNHWSTRTLAQAMDVSHSTVFRVWQSQNLQPQDFVEERVRDIVGLYVSAKDSAVVFTADKNLDAARVDDTNPKIALKRERARSYYRVVKAGLLQAIDDLAFVGPHEPREQLISFMGFLDSVDVNTSERHELHIIAVRGGVARSRMAGAWFTANARCHVHFVPAGARWNTFVQRWLAGLSPEGMNLRSFAHLAELTSYIKRRIAGESGQPIIWTASRHASHGRHKPWSPFESPIFDLVTAFGDLLTKARSAERRRIRSVEKGLSASTAERRTAMP